MKSRTLMFTAITAMTLLAALTMPFRLAAQEQKKDKKEHHRYKFVDIGTFGGRASYINPFGNGGPYLNGHDAAVGSPLKRRA